MRATDSRLLTLSQLADVILTLIQSGAFVSANDDSALVERLNDLNTKEASNATESFTDCQHFQAASVSMSSARLSCDKDTLLSRLLTEISKIHSISCKPERRTSKLKSAIEHLTSFQVSVSRDFSSECHMVANDFQAMYAYKCQLYDECLRFCEDNVDKLLHVDRDSVADVFIMKESDLSRLVDDD